ncbi:hypothetical protein J7E50_18130 [Pedobacter sp. ISL-68]|uniref:hypothetical protein n=1 Tax=unclassified Pedobacter TaxID=2628915 RepID=UPI001BE8A6D9|nr:MULTISPECIES: hypothetical protein [unclassified Pedobacter]MBT2559843.1 hypothetical protein [Pedobacter sp. ISL-64]MBT2592148.1 hypothetical protein [Pedobacter sp. ISL-68]
MDNQQPTLEELEVYQKVNQYLERKIDKGKDQDRFSILPKQKWLAIIIIVAAAIIAFSSYYGLTTLIFGEEFWLQSVVGGNVK